VVNRKAPGGRPEWLPPEAARAIAEAARAVLAHGDNPKEAKAAVRAAAVGCLPSLPAPMLAEVVAAVAPADPPPPEHALPNVAAADAGRLARRLAVLASGANAPAGAAAERLAARLARAGTARVGEGDGH
jgi:predicted DNA-binding transcriptional regulator YafY